MSCRMCYYGNMQMLSSHRKLFGIGWDQCNMHSCHIRHDAPDSQWDCLSYCHLQSRWNSETVTFTHSPSETAGSVILTGLRAEMLHIRHATLSYGRVSYSIGLLKGIAICSNDWQHYLVKLILHYLFTIDKNMNSTSPKLNRSYSLLAEQRK